MPMPGRVFVGGGEPEQQFGVYVVERGEAELVEMSRSLGSRASMIRPMLLSVSPAERLDEFGGGEK